MTRKPVFRLFLISIGFFCFNQAAQAYWYNNPPFTYWYMNGGYAAYGGYGGFSSTAAEGYLRGMGAYIDAVGRLHVNNAHAAVHFQQAYRQYLINEKTRIQTRIEIKKMWEEYRAAHKTKPRLPPRMSAAVRDRISGSIRWTRALRLEDFGAQRKEMEALFTDRANHPEDSGVGSENYTRIRDLARSMGQTLRTLEKEMKVSKGDATMARKLLQTLSDEAYYAGDV